VPALSRYRLNWYELTEHPSGDWFIKLPLCDVYSKLIDEAIPGLKHIGWRPATKTACYTYLKGPTTRTLKRVREFLEFLKHVLALGLNKNLEGHFTDELDQCFALDFNLEDPQTYTGVGALEYAAKYNQDEGSAEKLAELLAESCEAHPRLSGVDFIGAIPANPGKTFHLPDLLVERMGKHLGRKTGLKLRKTKKTPSLKNLTLKDKLKAIKGVFTVDDDVSEQSVLLVDDLYQSGTTMWTLAKLLKEHGAEKVYGLACVKSWRDTGNV
jgi:hypothetical protein